MSKCEKTSLIGLSLVAAALYLWNLSSTGWGNAYYAAASQAGASNWTAFFFASSDLGNGITIDKLPASIWLSSLSIRLFGLSSWSLLVPQALIGVGTVVLTYLTVRRHFHPTAAFLSGLVIILTPAAAVLFRYNNPDALLTLLLSSSVYLLLRAVEDGRWRWLICAGVAVGLGFLTKSAQSLIILPVLAIVYALAGPGKLGRRILQLISASAAVAASAGWWIVIAENWQSSERPYAGGSFTNSFTEVILQQNGLGRLLGAAGGGSSQIEAIKPGPLKLIIYPQFGTQGSWLLPAALILLSASLIFLRKRPRIDPKRALLLLGGGWLVSYAGVFSYMSGVINPYYLIGLAPPLGIILGAGSRLSWAARRWLPFRIAHCGALLISAFIAEVYLSLNGGSARVAGLCILGLAALLAGLMLLRTQKSTITRVTATAAAAVCLTAPAMFAVSGVVTPHAGVWPAAALPQATFVLDSPDPRRWPAEAPVGLRGTSIGHTPEVAALTLLAADKSGSRWTAATPGAANAARYQLGSGASVLPVGGFNGNSPFPKLEEFRELAQSGQIRYYIARTDSLDIAAEAGYADDITQWVRATFTPRVIGQVEIYDLQSR